MIRDWQLSEELTGYPPTDKTTIEEESSWIHSHLTGDGFLSFFGNEHKNKDIDQKDIVNVMPCCMPTNLKYAKMLCNVMVFRLTCFFVTCQISS